MLMANLLTDLKRHDVSPRWNGHPSTPTFACETADPMVRASDTFVIAGCSLCSASTPQSLRPDQMGAAGQQEPGGSDSTLSESSVGMCLAGNMARAGRGADHISPRRRDRVNERGKTVNRNDYAYPFRIDPASGQAAQAGYADHVDQMIRQILLTAPGSGPICRSSAAAFGSWSSPRNSHGFGRHYPDPGATSIGPLALRSDNGAAGTGQPAARRGQEQQLQVEIDYTLIETQPQNRTIILVS